MTCIRCFTSLEPDAAFCGNCGTAVAVAGPPAPAVPAAQPIFQPSSFAPAPSGGFAPAEPAVAPPAPAPPPFTHTPASHASVHAAPVWVTADFKLAHAEVVKATYDVASKTGWLGSMRGRLVVTDARVLYRSEARNVLNESRQSTEIQLHDVNGLRLASSKGISPVGAAWLLMLAVWVALPSFLLLVNGQVLGLFGLMACAVVAVVVYFRSRHAKLVFAISSREAGSTPILLTSGLTGAVGGLLGLLVYPLIALMEVCGITSAAMTDTVAEFETTLAMYDEIGALILDLQSRGVLGNPSA